jgi:putative ABC transport system permease protein
MNIHDMIELGFADLWRTRLRTVLTISGVMIGIGALTSMISFGTGMQKNITETFRKNDLFTSIYVTAINIELNQIARGDISGVMGDQPGQSTPLNDSTLEVIRKIEGIEIAYPDMTFQARAEILGMEKNLVVAELPFSMQQYAPFNKVTWGKFFDSDTSRRVLLNWNSLKQMKIVINDPDQPVALNEEDRKNGYILMAPDSLIGKKIILTTATLDIPSMLFRTLGITIKKNTLPLKEIKTTVIIGGIIKNTGPFEFNILKGDLFMPFKTAEKIPKLAVSNILDMLGQDQKKSTYNSIYVRVNDPEDVDRIALKLKAMNLNVLALSDQLKQITRQFLLMDGLLGAVGTIALIVAGLGIMNTMIMSILERTREIGIMKAIGGSEPQIRMIFFVEAGVIGFFGALFGLILGWVVTLIANQVANARLLPLGEGHVDFFYFPLWLIIGAVIFSVALSLIAGVYPAYRAARVDPVKALRHD